MSKFTIDYVYGFDGFEGLPEKWREGFDVGTYGTIGNLPELNDDVVLMNGLVQ